MYSYRSLSKGRIDHGARAIARAAPREQNSVRGAVVGVASALILFSQAPADALAPKFPSAEEQRAIVEAQSAKLEALLEKQMAQSKSDKVHSEFWFHKYLCIFYMLPSACARGEMLESGQLARTICVP
jgi:hypothetical protein